ncbi:guanylin-like [Eublepharis macularius]|uniref:Guanylate cyclase activator 2B n=1 Tax=Eublepharis macularius TaxID=481883 RepID=A0AA97LJT3_EUBMA|nr:guanylin-like [Eublepharis macularius]
MDVVFAPVMFVLLILTHGSQAAVQVQDGEFSFSLDSVKKMKELLAADARPASARARSQTSQVTFLQLCLNPELPKDLRPVCAREDAPDIFTRLDLAVEDPDLCELCVNAACTGCY